MLILMLLLTQIIATGCFFSDVPENTVNKDSSPQRFGLPSTSDVEEELIRLKSRIENLEDKTINDLRAGIQANFNSNEATAGMVKGLVENNNLGGAEEELDKSKDNIDGLIQSNTSEINDVKLVLNSAEENLFNLKYSKKHVLNFPAGVCSNRELMQIQIDTSEIQVSNPLLQKGIYILHDFQISFKGDVGIDNSFGVVPDLSNQEDWLVTVKIYADNELVRTETDLRMDSKLDITKFELSLNSPTIISVTVEYGVGKTNPDISYSDNINLSTVEKRIESGDWENCVNKDDSTIFMTNKYASVSFQQQAVIIDNKK